MSITPEQVIALEVLEGEKGAFDIRNKPRTTIERYRRLEKRGFCAGVGIRFVSLTPEGRTTLRDAQKAARAKGWR